MQPVSSLFPASYSDEALLRRLPGFTDHYATVNGVRLHYVEDGSGPVLVCLPGWPQTWYSYHPIAAGLARHYRVIIVDIRGMGSSEKPAAGYDKKTMAQDIYELLRHLGVTKASILGHDIGGMVASSFGFNYPQATHKLILADGAHPSEGLRQMPLLPAPGSFTDKMNGQQPYLW
ncbi:alpha/beta fold hydrolase [Hymenobacter guriensis]|uniref:alpha/beta fold hydrolase n=1 Tax=Hymenobacter guriensis TaxID=2793065 RepID=UPI0018CA81BB|nr:alpha/beta hydrolase [Hymenobacter guriensis]